MGFENFMAYHQKYLLPRWKINPDYCQNCCDFCQGARSESRVAPARRPGSQRLLMGKDDRIYQRSMLDVPRQADREHRSLPCLAGHGHIAAVGFDYGFDKTQPQAKPALRAA